MPRRAARSLKVRKNCINKVKSALTRSNYSKQEELANDVKLGLATISNFLNGRQVDRMNFYEICLRLNLNWEEVADINDREEMDFIDSRQDSLLPSNLNSPLYSSGAVSSTPHKNSEIVVLGEIEEQTNEDEASTDSPASLTQPLEQVGVIRQKMMSEIEVTGNLEAKDLIQKAKPGNCVEQEMATNLKAENIKFDNLIQEG